MLEEGRTSQTATILLMQAVAESIDLTVEQHRLCLWKPMQAHVRLPAYVREIHHRLRGRLPDRVVNWLTVDRLELAASMSAAYLRALRQARQQLRSFLRECRVRRAVCLPARVVCSAPCGTILDMSKGWNGLRGFFRYGLLVFEMNPFRFYPLKKAVVECVEERGA